MALSKKHIKEIEERQARLKEMWDSVGIPVLTEVLKGIKGLTLGRPSYVNGALPVHMANLPDTSHYSGVVNIKFKGGQVTILRAGYNVDGIPLGDPDLVKKLRRAILRWKQGCKAKMPRDN